MPSTFVAVWVTGIHASRLPHPMGRWSNFSSMLAWTVSTTLLYLQARRGCRTAPRHRLLQRPCLKESTRQKPTRKSMPVPVCNAAIVPWHLLFRSQHKQRRSRQQSRNLLYKTATFVGSVTSSRPGSAPMSSQSRGCRMQSGKRRSGISLNGPCVISLLV